MVQIVSVWHVVTLFHPPRMQCAADRPPSPSLSMPPLLTCYQPGANALPGHCPITTCVVLTSPEYCVCGGGCMAQSLTPALLLSAQSGSLSPLGTVGCVHIHAAHMCEPWRTFESMQHMSTMAGDLVQQHCST